MTISVCSQACPQPLESPECSANLICAINLACFTFAPAQSDVNPHKFHAITPLILLLHVSGSKAEPLMLARVLIMRVTASIYTL